MHSEDLEKLVYLSSLISLHLRFMGNKQNTSLSYYIHTRQTNDTDQTAGMCLSYSYMQYVGSLTARPVKTYYGFKNATIIGTYHFQI